MSNKRITELAPISLAEISDEDLFPIADVSVPETKKITMADVASWVAYSASAVGVAYAESSSYSETASFLLYSGGHTGYENGRTNGTASYAISASWAALAYSASHVISSSHTVTASYALTCSFFDGTISGAFSVASADTASFLRYQGYPNGTASYAFYSNDAGNVSSASYARTSSWSLNNTSASYAQTASVLVGANAIFNGTSSWANTASIATFLRYGATPNGTASLAMTSQVAYTANTASSLGSGLNAYLYREFDEVTSSLLTPYTASFGWLQLTGSGPIKVIFEAWGDVKVSMSESRNYSCSLESVLEDNTGRYSIDISTLQYYFTGSTMQNTGSIICPFYLKGRRTLVGTQRFSASVLAYNGLQLYTGSRDVQCSVKANTDYFTDE